MKKYKVCLKNDPTYEVLFYVKAKNLEQATLKACKTKGLEEMQFSKIFTIQTT